MSLEHAQGEITTERLLLRPLAMTDAPHFYEIYSDPEAMTFWSDQPVATVEEAAQMIRADLDMAARGVAAFWAIALNSSAEAIGKCTLMHYSAQNRRAEIGFILNRGHWRQGLMCEAVTAVIDFAFNELGLHRIEADTDDQNEASLSLLDKLGFQREGFFRERWRVYDDWQNSVMLGLLKPDWENR